MKVDIKGNQSETNLKPLEVYKYSLDSGSVATALIAETLRKSYKYPIRTLIQEYMSNARDVHRELGIKKAIQVQIPTELNPEVYIRDFGYGIAPDKIVDYITFAHSTKRTNNELTGGFGYGSKSGFSYTDSFTIISFHKGIKYTYRASVSEHKEGALILVSKQATTEPDGLKIQIAVRKEDRSRFKDAFLRLKNFWTTQEIEILNLNESELVLNNVLIKNINNVSLWDCSKSLESEEYEYRSSMMNMRNSMSNNMAMQSMMRNQLLMNMQDINKINCFFLIDEIPYPIDNIQLDKEVCNYLESLSRKKSLAISIPTGKIKVSKYREYIEDNPETADFINHSLKEAIKDIKTYCEKELSRPISNINDFDESYMIAIKQWLSFNDQINISLHINNNIIKASIMNGESSVLLSIPIDSSTQEAFPYEYKNHFDPKTPSNKLIREKNYDRGLSYYTPGTLRIKIDLIKKKNIKYADADDLHDMNSINKRVISSFDSLPINILYYSDEYSEYMLEIFDFLNIKDINSVEENEEVLNKYKTYIPDPKQDKPITKTRVNRQPEKYYYEVISYNTPTCIKEYQLISTTQHIGAYTKEEDLKAPKLIINQSKKKKINMSMVRLMNIIGYKVLIVKDNDYDFLKTQENTYDFYNFISKKIIITEEMKEKVKKVLKISAQCQLIINHNNSKLLSAFEYLPKLFTKEETLVLKSMDVHQKVFEEQSSSSNPYLYKEDIKYFLEKNLVDGMKDMVKESSIVNKEFDKIVEFYDFLYLIQGNSSQMSKKSEKILMRLVKRLRKEKDDPESKN